jgi:hypothetical protein
MTPNKRFVFIFEDTSVDREIGGEYKISREYTHFRKEGEELVVSVNCDFDKI